MLLAFAGFEILPENLKFIDKHVYLLISNFVEESNHQLQIGVSELFIFRLKFCFLGLSLEHFSKSNFKIFHHQPTKVEHFYKTRTN